MIKSNIILIILDTLRGDRLLQNFRDKDLTPNIRNLLKKAIYFENCIANSPWTFPSHINMFTGLYSTQYNLIKNKHKKIQNLTEILKENGYDTLCFTENPLISEINEFSRGFETLYRSWKAFVPWIDKTDRIAKIIKSLSFLDAFLRKWIKSNYLLRTWGHLKFRIEKLFYFIIKKLFWKIIISKFKNNTLNNLVKFKQILKEKGKGKPLYIYFNIMATHYPFLPTRDILKYFAITFEDFKLVKKFMLDPQKFRRNVNIRAKKISTNKIKIIKALYNASVYFSDLITKEIILLLKNLDLEQNSYIIITSDHGEHLCDKSDHYFWEHHTYLSIYEPLIRVPLIIYNTNYQYNLIKNQVQLKDIFHTILHLTGIPKDKNKHLILENSMIYQINTNLTPTLIFGEYLKPREELYNLLRFNRRIINKELIPRITHKIFFLRSNKYKFITYNDKIFYNL
ncbi:hypothetical protein LCGC14_2406010, partial [marine sediment metagenome]